MFTRDLKKLRCLYVCSYSSFLFLVVRPGAPSSVLAPSSEARSPQQLLVVLFERIISSRFSAELVQLIRLSRKAGLWHLVGLSSCISASS